MFGKKRIQALGALALVFAILLFVRTQSQDSKFAKDACTQYQSVLNLQYPVIDDFKPDSFQKIDRISSSWGFSNFAKRLSEVDAKANNYLQEASSNANSAAKRNEQYQRLSKALNGLSLNFKVIPSWVKFSATVFGEGLQSSDWEENKSSALYDPIPEFNIDSRLSWNADLKNSKIVATNECRIVLAK